MKKRFIGKRKKRYQLMRGFLFLSLVFIFFLLSFHFLTNKWKNSIKTDEMLEIMFKNEMGSNDFYNFLKLNPTEYLFSSGLGFHIPKSEMVFDEEEDLGPTYEYVPDPSPKVEIKDPIIYIYNTHQTEGYNKEKTNDYDITPTVLFASYYLREKLNAYGLKTLVETNDITSILNMNGWKYSASYEASRYLYLDAKEKNPTLKYFFDIHRDSAGYNATTIENEGKKYAKILFVIGKEHDNWEKNQQFASQLNEIIKSKISTISRGIIGKEGKNVNGIYNQDISPNTLVLEIGGKDNTIEEVTNTMEILASSLKDYIEGMK